MPYTPYNTATEWQTLVGAAGNPSQQLMVAIDILGAIENGGGGGGGVNIYNSDGTLTANRTVTTSTFDLTVVGNGNILLEKTETTFNNYLNVGTLLATGGEGAYLVREDSAGNQPTVAIGAADATIFGKDANTALIAYIDNANIQSLIFADSSGVEILASDNNPAHFTNSFLLPPNGTAIWSAVDNTTPGIHSNINIDTTQVILRHQDSLLDVRGRVDINNTEVWSTFENATGTILAQTKLDLDGLRVIGIDQTAGVAAFRVQDGSLNELLRIDNDGLTTVTNLSGSGGGLVGVNNDGTLFWTAAVAGIASWSLGGNAGLIDGVNNFIGTTDAAPIKIIANGVASGILGAGTFATAFGVGSLASFTYPALTDEVTAFGQGALPQLTTGRRNIGIGISSGASIVDGNDCIFIGHQTDTLVPNPNNCLVLGNNAVATSDSQFAIGSQTNLNFASITNIKTAALVAYADDAAAGGGGLVTGDWYQTTGGGAAPLNAAGIIMIKQ